MRSRSIGKGRTASLDNLLVVDNPEIKLNNEFQVYVKNYRRAYNEETDEDDKNGIFKMTF